MALTHQQVKDKYYGQRIDGPVSNQTELLIDVLLTLTEMNERNREYYRWIMDRWNQKNEGVKICSHISNE